MDQALCLLRKGGQYGCRRADVPFEFGHRSFGVATLVRLVLLPGHRVWRVILARVVGAGQDTQPLHAVQDRARAVSPGACGV
jgi:hypothetical protein